MFAAKEPVKEGNPHFISTDGKNKLVLFNREYAGWFTDNGIQHGDTISAKIAVAAGKFYIAIPIEKLDR